MSNSTIKSRLLGFAGATAVGIAMVGALTVPAAHAATTVVHTEKVIVNNVSATVANNTANALKVQRGDQKCPSAPSATEDGAQYNSTNHQCWWISSNNTVNPSAGPFIVYTIEANSWA